MCIQGDAVVVKEGLFRERFRSLAVKNFRAHQAAKVLDFVKLVSYSRESTNAGLCADTGPLDGVHSGNISVNELGEDLVHDIIKEGGLGDLPLVVIIGPIPREWLGHDNKLDTFSSELLIKRHRLEVLWCVFDDTHRH